MSKREHVSFSEVKCWRECPWRHKLLHIDKIGTFEPSPFLDFGTTVHEGCETFLHLLLFIRFDNTRFVAMDFYM